MKKSAKKHDFLNLEQELLNIKPMTAEELIKGLETLDSEAFINSLKKDFDKLEEQLRDTSTWEKELDYFTFEGLTGKTNK